MPAEETIINPAVGAADLETRKAANETSHVDDIFNDSTTDDSAAAGTTPAAEGVKTAEELAAEGLVEPPATKTGTSNEDLVAALREAFPNQTPAAPTTKTLSPEEISRALGAVEPSDEDVAALQNPETAKATLKRLLDAAANNGATMASVIIRSELEKLNPELQRVREHQMAEIASREEKAFFDEYPALADPKLRKVLELVTNRLASEPNPPKTPAERRKRLAESCEEVIKSANPAFVLVPAASTQPKTKTTVPRQAVAATTGGGGAAGPTHHNPEAGEKNRSKGVEVWD